MAAITVLAPDYKATPGYATLESIAIVNLADTSTVKKCFAVPPWANYATFILDITAVGGTAPKLDFVLNGCNIADTFPPDDADLFVLGAGWDGITQKTAASTSTIHLGPDITTDDTGSATADDAYGVGCVLPPWLAYTYVLDGAAVGDDQDYTASIAVYWRA